MPGGKNISMFVDPFVFKYVNGPERFRKPSRNGDPSSQVALTLTGTGGLLKGNASSRFTSTSRFEIATTEEARLHPGSVSTCHLPARTFAPKWPVASAASLML